MNDKTTSRVNGRELIVRRVFDAPREAVFKAWTNPGMLQNWWGPEGFTLSTNTIEIKPDGQWQFVMHGPDGADYDNTITYNEIQSPEKITYTHGGSEEAEAFDVTVTFEAHDHEKTALTMHTMFPSEEALAQAIEEYGAIEGAKSTLDRLENQLEKRLHSWVNGRHLILERLFDAPRERVWKAHSESSELTRWWGPKGWITTNHQFEFKPEGVWYYTMRSPEGRKSSGKAVYHEIKEPEQLVYTDHFVNDDGKPIKGMPELLVTLTFTDVKGRTKLTMDTEIVTDEALQSILKMGVIQGFEENWNALDKHLKENQT